VASCGIRIITDKHSKHIFLLIEDVVTIVHGVGNKTCLVCEILNYIYTTFAHNNPNIVATARVSNVPQSQHWYNFFYALGFRVDAISTDCQCDNKLSDDGYLYMVFKGWNTLIHVESSAIPWFLVI
jgi:hypothetical protein